MIPGRSKAVWNTAQMSPLLTMSLKSWLTNEGPVCMTTCSGSFMERFPELSAPYWKWCPCTRRRRTAWARLYRLHLVLFSALRNGRHFLFSCKRVGLRLTTNKRWLLRNILGGGDKAKKYFYQRSDNKRPLPWQPVGIIIEYPKVVSIRVQQLFHTLHQLGLFDWQSLRVKGTFTCLSVTWPSHLHIYDLVPFVAIGPVQVTPGSLRDSRQCYKHVSFVALFDLISNPPSSCVLLCSHPTSPPSLSHHVCLSSVSQYWWRIWCFSNNSPFLNKIKMLKRKM